MSARSSSAVSVREAPRQNGGSDAETVTHDEHGRRRSEFLEHACAVGPDAEERVVEADRDEAVEVTPVDEPVDDLGERHDREPPGAQPLDVGARSRSGPR